MLNVIVDSSVVTKWYFEENEEDVEAARQLLQFVKSGEYRLVAPQITLLELANVVKFSKKQSQKKCLAAVSLYEQLLDSLAPLPSIDLIINQIYKQNLTSYDAVFTTLAINMDISLITADYKHHQKFISKNIIWLKEWNGKV